MKRNSTLLLNGEIVVLDRPWVMGILNATPDSFYAESRVVGSSQIESCAARMVEEGADILDIGGYSSRLGADEVSADEEFARVASALEVVRRRWPHIPVSVDTFRASVARKAIEDFGVEIINDISGGELDPQMWPLVAEKKVVYVLMHMRGTPVTMQSQTQYDDVTADVIRELMDKVARLRQLGVADIILDPGFGFAKTVEQNFRLLGELEQLKMTGLPLLVGMSRKSMLYKSLDITPQDALPATVAVHMAAIMKGADIIRVHDVLPAVQSVQLYEMMCNS